MQRIIDILIEKIKDEWTLAGHPLTGSFEESLVPDIVEGNDSVIINILGNEYGIYLSEGVTPENIPYTTRRGTKGKRGGKSKYITGLHNWVKLRLGINDERESLGIAFAIAEKHAENGITGSKFLDEITNKHNQEIQTAVSEYLDELIEERL